MSVVPQNKLPCHIFIGISLEIRSKMFVKLYFQKFLRVGFRPQRNFCLVYRRQWIWKLWGIWFFAPKMLLPSCWALFPPCVPKVSVGLCLEEGANVYKGRRWNPAMSNRCLGNRWEITFAWWLKLPHRLNTISQIFSCHKLTSVELFSFIETWDLGPTVLI